MPLRTGTPRTRTLPEREPRAPKRVRELSSTRRTLSHLPRGPRVGRGDRPPPGIIDFSPYWRPPSYAEGTVNADALNWHGAPPTLPDQVDVPLAAVARGLLFRVLTTSGTHPERSTALADEAPATNPRSRAFASERHRPRDAETRVMRHQRQGSTRCVTTPLADHPVGIEEDVLAPDGFARQKAFTGCAGACARAATYRSRQALHVTARAVDTAK